MVETIDNNLDRVCCLRNSYLRDEVGGVNGESADGENKGTAGAVGAAGVAGTGHSGVAGVFKRDVLLDIRFALTLLGDLRGGDWIASSIAWSPWVPSIH